MNRKSWLCLVVAGVALGSLGSGCGDSNNNGDGGHGLGDGHVQMGCSIDPDCDDGSKCHTGHCNIVTHMCMFTDVMCPAPDACNLGTCDPSDGTCGTTATNEGGDCTTTQGTAGKCTVGFCQPIPSCWDPMNSFNMLACTQASSGNTGDNDPLNVGFGVTNAITSYGNCATNETQPEVAFQFMNSNTTDEQVTVHLQWDPSGSFGADAGTATDPDLDLIVIEGANCVGSATCMNPSRASGGFQGITAGTSDERVTFTAKASTQYYIVVDSKVGHDFFKLDIDACGKCQPTPATTLSCNMSMSLSGNTMTGDSNLGAYTCPNSGGTGTVMLPGAGKEQVFFYDSAAPVVQKVKATVSGASADVTLAAIPENTGTMECAPAMCVAGASTVGTNAPNKTATITWNAQVSDTFTPNRYFVVVDAQTATDTPFGLQFTCQPYCAADSTTLDCSATPKVTSASGNNASGVGNSVSAWGPTAGPFCGGLMGLTGHEYVYMFHKGTTSVTQLTLTMAAATPGKHLALLVLDAGAAGGATCDPAGTCATTSPVTVAADPAHGILASTGSYTADGPTSASSNDAKTAVINLTVPLADHYYWIVVDGVNGDASDFAISISGC